MIPLMKNAFLNEYETKKALAEFILHAGRLSMDAECLKFERKFNEFQGRKDSVLFNSGGSANLAMLQALKNLGTLKDGDRVGFSALTCEVPSVFRLPRGGFHATSFSFR